MLRKSIKFAHEAINVNNDNVDVFIEFENNYTYCRSRSTVRLVLKNEQTWQANNPCEEIDKGNP